MKKRDVLRSIVSVLAADGKIVQEEKHFLVNLCKQLGISQETVTQILQEAKQGNRDIYIPDAPKEKRVLYKLLLQAACSDGSVSPEEQELLESFAIQIGMNIDDIQQAVANYLQETLPQNTQALSTQETALARNIRKPMLSLDVLRWKDLYKTRVDEVLTVAFPQLELRLKEVVEKKAVEMLKGGPKKFTKELLEPEIINWVKQHTEPLMQEAQAELTQIVTHIFEHNADFNHEHIQAGGSSMTKLLALGEEAWSRKDEFDTWAKISDRLLEEDHYYRHLFSGTGITPNILLEKAYPLDFCVFMLESLATVTAARFQSLMLCGELETAKRYAEELSTWYDKTFDPLSPIDIALRKASYEVKQTNCRFDQAKRELLKNTKPLMLSLRELQGNMATRPQLIQALIDQNINGYEYVQRLRQEDVQPLLVLPDNTEIAA